MTPRPIGEYERCKFCRYWVNDGVPWRKSHRTCDNNKLYSNLLDDGLDFGEGYPPTTGPEFGCIHFEVGE